MTDLEIYSAGESIIAGALLTAHASTWKRWNIFLLHTQNERIKLCPRILYLHKLIRCWLSLCFNKLHTYIWDVIILMHSPYTSVLITSLNRSNLGLQMSYFTIQGNSTWLTKSSSSSSIRNSEVWHLVYMLFSFVHK